MIIEITKWTTDDEEILKLKDNRGTIVKDVLIRKEAIFKCFSQYNSIKRRMI